MSFDAIIVAGGRGSRLGGVSKPLLTRNGRSLLACALDAVAGAGSIVVVGTRELTAVVDAYAAGAPAGQRVLVTREDPAYGGPAAAVAAGRRALDALCDDAQRGTEHTVVVAADMLEPGPLVTAVLDAALSSAADPGRTAWVPVDDAGRLQPLGCVIGSSALRAAIAHASAVAGTLENASMMRLLATVQIERLKLKDLDFSDIDTPADVGRYGIEMPIKDEAERIGRSAAGGNMALDSALEPWVRRLLADFELVGTEIDINEILELAGDAAHGIVRPAAPLTTYIAGYAAGLAVAAGQASQAEAMESAAAHVRSVLAAYLDEQGTETA